MIKHERADGLIVLDWTRHRPPGPYITLTRSQWLELLAVARKEKT